MQTTQEEMRNFLLKNGMYQTLSTFDQEIQSMNNTQPTNSPVNNPQQTNINLNLSFGEGESNNMPNDGSFKLDNQISIRNNFDFHFDKSHSQSNQASSNSQQKTRDPILPPPHLFDQKGFPENPFEILNYKMDDTNKKSLNLQNEEDKFSFGAENDNENDFDSFSKSHNNKFSKNDNDEIDVQNMLGNSFDNNLLPRNTPTLNKTQMQSKSKTGNQSANNDEILRPNSDIYYKSKPDSSPKQLIDLHKNNIKSIDTEPGRSKDLRSQANVRTSHGYGTVFANNRQIAKKLFPGIDSDDIFQGADFTTDRQARKSEGTQRNKGQHASIKPDFADGAIERYLVGNFEARFLIDFLKQNRTYVFPDKVVSSRTISNEGKPKDKNVVYPINAQFSLPVLITHTEIDKTLSIIANRYRVDDQMEPSTFADLLIVP